MATRVGINGFGRIGRNFYRAYLERNPGFEIVAVNDLASPEVLAHVLKYDSSHGVLEGQVEHGDGEISVDGKSFEVLSERDPTALPWADRGVDVVIESTGLFTDREGASQHLTAGAKKVVISAPATNPDVTLVLGVNDDKYDPAQHNLISMASCTTNSVGRWRRSSWTPSGSVETMTTIHAYTTEQQLQDQIAVTRKGKVDLRRIRAAALNIIPASTGATKAIGEVIPELKGKLDGMAMRVPVPDGSVTDLVVVLSREASVDEVNDAFRSAAGTGGWARDRLRTHGGPIVSHDIVGNPASCIGRALDNGAREPGEGDRLVRQRVGLQLPPR